MAIVLLNVFFIFVVLDVDSPLLYIIMYGVRQLTG